jgi:hypothetical protein
MYKNKEEKPILLLNLGILLIFILIIYTKRLLKLFHHKIFLIGKKII